MGLSRGLLRDAGLRIQNGKNDLTARVENFPADLMFVRDDDIPIFVSDGVCEYGIVGENVLEHLQLDLQLEIEAVEALREAISHCQSVGDYTTRKMFEEMIASEESHIDWIENQLEAIKQIGLELYLSQQLKDE